MCDHSLHNVKTRPAKVGDKLTTRFFQSGTRGFCAPEGIEVSPVGKGWRAAIFAPGSTRAMAERAWQ
jgi:hypothetical protein